MTIDDLRTQTITDLGYTSFWTGAPKAYVDLSAQEQINVTNAMEKYIAAHPSDFSQTQVDISTQTQAAGGITDIQDYTYTQAAQDFGDEVANQAVAINQAVNPFANKTLLYALLVAGAIVIFIAVNNKTATHK